MISSFLQNSTFSSTLNQVNNKSAPLQNKDVKNESLNETKKSEQGSETTATSKVDSIKEGIKNGTYKIDLRASAEKLAQELLR